MHRMTEIHIISNRLPISIEREDGKLLVKQSIGGLATGLGSLYRSHDCTWTGWPGISVEKGSKEEDEVNRLTKEELCNPVHLTSADINKYYHGFSNATLWPLFHYFRSRVTCNSKQWKAYINVNRKYLEALHKVYKPGDTIWVHDYHLLLLPAMLREEFPDATIGFFNHIPFPSYEIFRALPWRRELLEGMLGADLIGFHTYDYVRHFLECVDRILGYRHTHGEISAGNHLIKVDSFPMGIDYNIFQNAVSEKTVQDEIKKIRQTYEGYKLLLSFDRLDYTKGIIRRLKAFDTFLKRNPEYHGKVVLILIAVPSRTAVSHYRQLKKQVDGLVGSITGRYGTLDWTPIRYFYDTLPFESLIATYHVADVALVTPLRDGMNLMAKEFLATRTDGSGVLILSEMAGASSELGEAIVINPFNRNEFVEAIETALSMPAEEQVSRNRQMQERLKRYQVEDWAYDFIHQLEAAKEENIQRGARILSRTVKSTLLLNYKNSKKRLIFLDYDGTLVPFEDRPEFAVPDEKLLKSLDVLSAIPGNEVVIISGRDRETLNLWSEGLAIGIVAEHGIWIRKAGPEWEMIEPLQNNWKEEILMVLKLYVDRTPGSFIEEKEFSLAWHYRKTDPLLGETRARELKDQLMFITAHMNLEVLEGSRVIEVKNASINKGKAALKWLSDGEWDFVLAVGDDWTDEYLFDVMPEDAYSIKVGFTRSKARYNIPSIKDVRTLIDDCILTGKSCTEVTGEDKRKEYL